MNIFITGASGFVGGAAAQHLAKAHTITAMSRSEKSDSVIAALGATPIRCDLNTLEASHLQGVDVVIHSAAKVESWGPMADFFRDNVEGTERLLTAARTAGVKRFIHIGTEAALFHGQPMRDIDETAPLALDSPFPYSRSKAHAETAVRGANDPAGGFTTIVLRPRFIWGPGDKSILPAIKYMVDSGKFMWIGGGTNRTSTTYIGNLVNAIELALEKGTPGEPYFITDGDPVILREFLIQLMASVGVNLPDRSAPGWLVRGIARVLAAFWAAFGRPGVPPIDPFTAALMSRDCTLVIAKAERELGYRPTIGLEEGLAATAAAARG